MVYASKPMMNLAVLPRKANEPENSQPALVTRRWWQKPGPLPKGPLSSVVCAEKREDSAIAGHTTGSVSVWLERLEAFQNLEIHQKANAD